MRGKLENPGGGLFSCVSSEARVPKDHPLRKIRELVRDVLRDLNRTLDALHSKERRPLDPAQAIAERSSAVIVLRHSLGTSARGAIGLNLLYCWFAGGGGG